jgi:outer membrane protein assembly factor BamA
VLLNPSRKYDFTANFEVSTGTTYFLGAAPTLTFRDKNLGKGANVLTTSVSGGVESIYTSSEGSSFFEHFSLLTKTYSFNATLDLPKFLSPVRINFTKRNAPRTIIGFGSSLIERIDYFTLTNTAANFSYNWRETSTKTWDLTPSFINNIRLPAISDSFQRRLENNDFLKNSYRETFIEGESIGFTFSNQFDNQGRSYTYIKLTAEEAGGLMGVLDGFHSLNYSQYVKFDFDARRYINYRKSQIALRFYGGVGLPYGQSPTLPYLKQYFVGGAYSIRGWRIRSLGPGSYFDDNPEAKDVYIDRTGDVKLEWNGEFRFDVVQLFGGSIRLKGALFTDAGNIWLSTPNSNYPGGEFTFSKLGHDIAISSGAGARLDIASFFILRFDVAFPLKIPYAEDGGWKLGSIRFGDQDWRKRNIILNVAVGYPF